MSQEARASVASRLRISARAAVGSRLQARFPFQSEVAIERAQRRRLRAMIEHAWRHVPYYSETMRRLELTPDRIRIAADLSRLPILDPQEVGRDPEYFVSRRHQRDDLIPHRTSGSTGEPRTYYRELASLPADATHFARVFSIAAKAAGKRLRPVLVSILPPVSSAVAAQSAYRKLSLPAVGVRHSNLSLLESPRQNLPRLNQLKPDVIFTFGSYVEDLFVYLERSGEEFHPPAAIIYAADPLSPAVRDRLRRDHGILSLGAYQAVEMTQLGFECERHSGLHVNVDLYPLRIVRPDGREAGPGETGEVIASNLVNRGTVLLNYRLRDLASPLAGRCGCGRNLPLISLSEGRSEDWIVLADGSRLHPQAISMWMYSVAGVVRYRLVQSAPAGFELEVVAEAGADRDAIEHQVRSRMAEHVGRDVQVEVGFLDQLPRGPGAKVRPVISKVKVPAAGAP